MKGNDNGWSGIKMALHEVKWKEMTMDEVELKIWQYEFKSVES